MHIDALTLMLAGSFVGVLSGILLLGAWARIREEKALLLWALASFIYAGGLGLLALTPVLPQPAGLVTGLGLMMGTPAMVWGGVRRFNRRRVLWPVVAGSLALWLVVIVMTTGGPSATSTVIRFSIWIGFLSAAAFELWRGRSEQLTARWPLFTLLVVHAAVFVGGLSDALAGKLTEDGSPILSGWFSIINIEALVYFMGTAVAMVGLAQQRRENRAVHVAGLDSLTGTANRGTFLNITERLLRRCREDSAPLSLIMFDLDHFKTINDTHGHLVGDNVIRAFAEVMQRALRPNDLVGRYGGEEFAVVLPGTTIEAAYVIADRIRHGFADTARVLGEVQIHATVSGGVAAAAAAMTVPQLVDAADRALYRAKNLGRNRIHRSDETPPRDNLIRVA